jgi:hypothetical protein
MMRLVLIVAIVATALAAPTSPADEGGAPDPSNLAATARYVAHQATWGALATITAPGASGRGAGTPFVNLFSVVDGERRLGR